MRERIVIVLSLLGGCTAIPGHPGGDALPLVPVRAIREPTTVAQQLTLQWNGRRLELMGIVERSDGRAALAVFTPLGIRLFSVVQTANRIKVDHLPQLPAALDPLRLYADAQFVNWSPAELNATYGRHWRMAYEERERSLWRGDRLMARVRYDGPPSAWRCARLENLASGYTLVVRRGTVTPHASSPNAVPHDLGEDVICPST